VILPGTYKQQLANYYSDRSSTYDESDFHQQLAERLVIGAALQPGQSVLDIATGTGLVAIAAAQQVGPQGRVVGIDLAPGMLQQAQQKREALGLNNLELQWGDAETLELADNAFDVILCCSALILIPDIPTALRRWRQCLKPGGLLGLTDFAETAFATSAILKQLAPRYGIDLPIFHRFVGTAAKCQALLEVAGFENIEITAEQFGNDLDLKQALAAWDQLLQTPFFRPLQQLPAVQRTQAQAEYRTILEAQAMDGRVWNDITTFFVWGHKPQKFEP
jgi:ubiquinone/menaquinone biosynthesis C-methylase UbiE